MGVGVTATDWHNGVDTPLDPSMLQRRIFSSLRVSGPSLLDWVGVGVTATDWHNGVDTPLDPSGRQAQGDGFWLGPE